MLGLPVCGAVKVTGSGKEFYLRVGAGQACDQTNQKLSPQMNANERK
jgi:hypothetical protein